MNTITTADDCTLSVCIVIACRILPLSSVAYLLYLCMHTLTINNYEFAGYLSRLNFSQQRAQCIQHIFIYKYTIYIYRLPLEVRKSPKGHSS